MFGGWAELGLSPTLTLIGFVGFEQMASYLGTSVSLSVKWE